MAAIEDYALIGDTHTAALVSRDGSIDWLCLPRFDSESVFASILDRDLGGYWSIRPTANARSIREYVGDTLVLETLFETETGIASLVDLMAISSRSSPDVPREIHPEDAIVRVVEVLEGEIEFEMTFAPRFDYGDIRPWLHRDGEVVAAEGGESALDLTASVPLEIDNGVVRSRFTLRPDEIASFTAAYRASYDPIRHELTCAGWEHFVECTAEFWFGWARRYQGEGPWSDLIKRSLLTLKALTYSPSGGIVAAPTTSLPEQPQGSRNWDYRYCWLRDATLTLEALIDNGYRGEAEEWHNWLLRSAAGEPARLQVMYTITGDRHLEEFELPFAGYEGAAPVRVGNAASQQFQLDTFGEVMDLFHRARAAGIDAEVAWPLQRELADLVLDRWREPDNGIWEVRGEPSHWIHSKVMAWVALDRAVKAIEGHGKDGNLKRWIAGRDEIHAEIYERGVDPKRGCFVTAYDLDEVDASLLRLPFVGFVPATDEVMLRTIEAIENDLLVDGLVRRYRTGKVDDGLPEGEGTFLLCTFWMVACLVLVGRRDDAHEMFLRAIAARNDVDLFSEEYDPRSKKMLGNFPQAFSHIAMITAATALEVGEDAPGLHRERS
ncbi:MAG TPA: glycoside hydrolase family 15 protein [Actinomycetota bacterium]|nr:glycoside hydrolase family 15 protein [Actinomycetota bacterium]